MESFEGEKRKDIVDAQAHIWKSTFSLINSMSLRCAVELGIPDAMHHYGKPMALSDLASALSIPSSRISCLMRLMRLLAHLGFFVRENYPDDDEEDDGDDVYSLTTSSVLLVKGHAISLRPFVLCVLEKTLLLPWEHMGAWFKGDECKTPFELAHGEPVWDRLNRLPDFNQVILELTASDANFVSHFIVQYYGKIFHGLSSLVDVGGGIGTMARAIAEAFPKVKCTVFELPHVAATIVRDSMIEVIAGDMFERIPPADAMLLHWFLCFWNDEECVRILKKCKEAIPSRNHGGKVIIIEMVVRTQKPHPELLETQLLYDMYTMAHTTGKQRTEAQWSKIFTDAGFTHYKMTPALGLRSIIEVYP